MKHTGWFRPYVRQHLWRFALVTVLGALGLGSAIALMYISGFLISKAALRPYNILMLYVPIVLVRTFGLGRAVFRYLERLVGHDIVLRILSQMRERLYSILEPQALFLRSRFKTGEILGVLSDDIEHLQDVYLRTIFPAITGLFLYVSAVLFLGYWDWRFAGVMALYAGLLVFVFPVLSYYITKSKQIYMKKSKNELYQHLTDAVLGIPDWLASGRHGEFIRSYEAGESELMRVERSVKNLALGRGFLYQLVTAAAAVSTAVWAGSRFSDGHLSAVQIGAFVLAILPLMEAFLPLSEAIERIPAYRDSYRRLAELEQPEQTGGEAPEAAERHGVAAGAKQPKAPHGVADEAANGERGGAAASAEQAKAPHGASANVEPLQAADGAAFGVPPERVSSAHIRLEDVAYRYAGADADVLKGISLDLPQGKKVAILGRSGAGKSTLLKLVQGALAPARGSVQVNGDDLHTLGDEVPHVLSVLNQSPHLFDTTVANNIRIGRPNASLDEVRGAAAAAQLDKLIESLPEGYMTPTREAGQRFSGGERQRIALARILLQDTPVIVLDEPTVGLDPSTEQALLATVFASLQGKSLLWITHHLAGVEQMDEILFIEHGMVAMRGTHAYLMENEPRYRRLYELDVPFQLPG